jgi:hypothetical protein
MFFVVVHRRVARNVAVAVIHGPRRNGFADSRRMIPCWMLRDTIIVSYCTALQTEITATSTLLLTSSSWSQYCSLGVCRRK